MPIGILTVDLDEVYTQSKRTWRNGNALSAPGMEWIDLDLFDDFD